MRNSLPAVVVTMAAASLAAGCSPGSGPPPGPAALPSVPSVSPISVDGGWVYQLQGYPDGRLDELIRAPQRIAVIDLARDAGSDFFTAEEVGALRGSGKAVLAYFEIGSIESFRPEYPVLRDQDPNLLLNPWPDWPDEYFVRYWDQRWWDVVRGRVDQALRAGFNGVYLDTPLAYEELDLSLVDGQSRESLAEAMVALIARTSRYAKAYSDGFLIVPQNSPELRAYPDYTTAIDGIGMEELFVRATDQPCAEEYCAENLANTRALRDAGKFVLAVDYATRAGLVAQTCAQYRIERFAGYVGVRELDRVSAACS